MKPCLSVCGQDGSEGSGHYGEVKGLAKMAMSGLAKTELSDGSGQNGSEGGLAKMEVRDLAKMEVRVVWPSIGTSAPDVCNADGTQAKQKFSMGKECRRGKPG